MEIDNVSPDINPVMFKLKQKQARAIKPIRDNIRIGLPLYWRPRMHNIDINNDGMPTQKKNNINKFDVVLMNSNIEHPNILVMGRACFLRVPVSEANDLNYLLCFLFFDDGFDVAN